MLKNDFIKMMKQDIITSDNKIYYALYELFVSVLSEYPNNTEIDNNKSIEECYKKMRFYAKKNQKDGMFAFTSEESCDFVRYYLKLKKVDSVVVNLEDFI